jgi:hypothetical protein
MDNDRMLNSMNASDDGKHVEQIDENTKRETITETFEADEDIFENQIKNRN